MVNKVEWIKLKTGIFDDYNFKRMKRNDNPSRDKLTAIWFEILDLVSKLYNRNYSLSGIDEIAVMIDRDEQEIRDCVEFYIKNKMMEIKDGCLFISELGFKKHNRYILDFGDKRTSQKYKDWRICVLERDGYKCRICNSKEQLNIHHIKKWSEYPTERFSVDNGMTLCKECHKKIHYGGNYGK